MPRELLDQEGAAFTPKPFGLPCPHCDLRSMVPLGERVYICVNPDCPGEPYQDLGQFVSMLTVDARTGARLRPWEEVAARDRARRLNPRATLLAEATMKEAWRHQLESRSVAQGEKGKPPLGEARATSGQSHASAGESPREPALPHSIEGSGQ